MFNTSATSLWALGAALLIISVWATIVYNRLVELRNRVANAFAQIDVQLKRRHDLIPNLVEVARGYMEHERETLQAVIAARSQAVQAGDKARAQPADGQIMGALAMAEQALMGQVGRLLALVEAYPDLKADQRLQDLHEALTTTENRIGFTRQAFNDAVLDLNNKVQSFPDLVVARLTGFTLAAPLESTTSEVEREVPVVKL